MNNHRKRDIEAYLDTFTMVTLVVFSEISGDASFSVTDHEKVFALTKVSEEQLVDRRLLHLVLDEKLPLHKEYWVIGSDGQNIPLQTGAIVRTMEFDECFAYEGEDLGANYSPEHTTFKVWAPTASSVRLKHFPNAASAYEYGMKLGNKGVWSLKLEGDHHLSEFSYLVRVNHEVHEAVDPYAKAVSLNGKRGVVVDLEKAQPDGWLETVSPPPLSKTDSVIYEVHVRDFSIHPASGIQHKGQYLGFTEKGTIGPGHASTGMDYLKSLGVTHIQILPVNDFGSVDERNPDTDYNWGYDPIHYNAPEGSYSTDASQPIVRIREYKELVAALHKNGLRVIMDVVYNHVFIREESHFEKIVPGYYFRFDTGGNPVNGTGVGNDTASERFMMRKFIVDSVKFWATEYKIDGFRFDLMGIHDVDTMNAIEKELKTINPAIFILGEGWKMNTWLEEEKKASIDAAKRMQGISFFNDRFRDQVKGNIFHDARDGFINSSYYDADRLFENMAGNAGNRHLFDSPGQSINYIECHDNHTLWDRLSLIHPHEDESILRKRHLLGTALVVFSQGVPFIHAGQEFFRTKQGDENSYRSGDQINRLDWERREKYSRDVQYVAELLRIRKKHPAFRMGEAAQIEKHVAFLPNLQPGVIGCFIRDIGGMDSWNHILLVFNHHLKEKKVMLPLQGLWTVAAEEMEVKEEGLYESDTGYVIVPPLGFSLLFKVV